MDREALAGRIEHTALGPETTPDDVRRVLDEALEHGMRACLPPGYVVEAVDVAPDVRLTTVVGFPHGNHATEVKRDEAVLAAEQGADELDVVCSIGRLRAGQLEAVERELAEVVAAVPVPVKVIVEAPLLSEAELHDAARAARAAGAAFLKTATGFAGDGTTAEDVALLADYLPTKAAGGIRTWSRARAMLAAGADRIGTSHGVDVLRGYDGERSPPGE